MRTAAHTHQVDHLGALSDNDLMSMGVLLLIAFLVTVAAAWAVWKVFKWLRRQ